MCNLMLIASSSLPRAGTVTVKTTLDTTFAVDITAEGPVVNFRPEAKQWLQGGVIEGSPSAHDVHFLTAHRSLKFCGASLRTAYAPPWLPAGARRFRFAGRFRRHHSP